MAFLHLVGHVVDDRVQADVDLLALGHVGGVAVGPHVEADDDGVRGRGQQHVRLVDGADARVDDADLDLLVGELLQRVGQHLGRAAHVGLDDDRQFLDAAFLDLLLQCPRACAGRGRPVVSLACVWRYIAIWRALAGSLITWKVSPGRRAGRRGRAPRPASTARALRTLRPRSSISARTLPTIGPAMNVSPTCSVPSCTSTVATGPRPRRAWPRAPCPTRRASGWP